MIFKMNSIFEQIRKAIKASEKTRYRLSKETGIPQSQLSRLMSKQEGLSVENIEKLADAMGLEIIIQPAKCKAQKAKVPVNP